jgi:hypothetical protein
MTTIRIIVIAFACLLLTASLAVLAGDGVIASSDELRTWIVNAGLSSDSVVESQAQYQTASSNPLRLAKAADLYRTLLYRDPANPYRWCDYADALQLTGDTERARKAFARAIELGPAIPPVQARAGNFYYAIGDVEAAVASYRTVLSTVHDYDSIIFMTLGRLGLQPTDVLARALPAERVTGANYLAFVMNSGTLNDTDAVWSWLRANKLADDATAARYIDYLLRKNSSSKAALAWADYLGERRGDYLRPNMVYNGSFKNAPTPSRLDWQIQPLEGVEASIDSGSGGNPELHIRFDGKSNVNYAHVSQTVCLSPGQYRFRARVRSDALTTNKGVLFYMTDPSGRLQWSTEAITGTHPWTWIEQDLLVPASQFQTLQIVRRPSEKIENKIEGSIWIQHVSIVKLGS